MGKLRQTKYVQDSSRLPVTKLIVSSRCVPTSPYVCDMRGKYFSISKIFLFSGQIGNTESELKKLAEENPDLQEAYIAKQKRLKVSDQAGSTSHHCILSGKEECCFQTTLYCCRSLVHVIPVACALTLERLLNLL